MRGSLLSIDPGDHTGWAYYKQNEELYPIVGQLTLSKPKKKVLTMHEQLSQLWERFDALLTSLMPVSCAIEDVQLWGGSLISNTSAKRGDLFKLSKLIGGYGYLCYKHSVNTIYIPAMEWKGQLTKDAIKHRIKKINGVVYSTDHITDAVGIGLHMRGYL